MSARPTGTKPNGTTADEKLNEVIDLLRQAIEQLDAVGAPPEFAAHLQGVLDMMMNRSKT